MRKAWMGAALGALALGGCTAADHPRTEAPPPAPHYVAMGSSFAAGPGVTQSADSPPNRCTRSADNFAHQLARKRGLELVDVSCGGATTEHILGPWAELPPQIDALTADTALVTITIGGNDLGYIGSLMTDSCNVQSQQGKPRLPICEMMIAYAAKNAPGNTQQRLAVPAPTEEGWRRTEERMERIAQEVHRRSPNARLIFVDYFTVLPESGLCDQTPLSAEIATRGRAIAARLADLTAAVARRTGAGLIKASVLSRDHDACSATPWITGFLPPSGAPDGMAFAPYHPNLAGMTGVAEALDRELTRKGWKGQAAGRSR